MAKYYVPDSTEEEVPLVSEGIGDPKYIDFETKTITDILAKHVYSDPMAGFRELYANSVRACKDAIEEHGADPSIEIRINPSTLDFSIMEHDGMGITHDIFDNVVTVLGRSSNFDGTKPGMFGIGMAAYFALSDNMFIESYARNGDKIHRLVRGMRIFEDVIKSNPVELESYGARMRLKLQKLKDEEKKYYEIDEHSNWHILEPAINYIKNLCKFSGVQTDLYIDGVLGDKWAGPTDHIRLGPLDPRDYIKEDDEYIFEIHNEDYDFIGTMYGNNYKHMTLAGMPMECQMEVKGDYFDLNNIFQRYIINVKNEREYMPVAARDMLKDKSMRKLNERLKQDLIKYVCSYDVSTFNEWHNLSFYKKDLFKRIAPYINRQYDEIGKYPEKFEKILALQKPMGIWCRVFKHGEETGSSSLEGVLKECKNEYRDKNIVLLKKFSKVKMSAINDDKVVIIPQDNRGYEILAKLLPDVTDVKINNRITIYNSRFTGGSIIYESEVKDDYLRVEKGARSIAKKLHDGEAENLYVFKGNTGGMTIKDYCDKITKNKYGGVKGMDLITDDKYVIVEDMTVLNRISNKRLGGMPILLNSDEITKLKTAKILLYNDDNMTVKNKRALYNMAGEEMGVEFEYCGGIGKILKCIDGIKDEELKKISANYLANKCRHESDKDAIVKITNLKNAIRKIKTPCSKYEKKLSLALNMPQTDRYYFEGILNKGKTTIDAAIAMGKALGGHDGKYIGSKGDDRNFSFILDGIQTCGGSRTRNMQDLEVLGTIKKFKMIENNGKISTQIWFSVNSRNYY